jgi:hypothetical protein
MMPHRAGFSIVMDKAIYQGGAPGPWTWPKWLTSSDFYTYSRLHKPFWVQLETLRAEQFVAGDEQLAIACAKLLKGVATRAWEELEQEMVGVGVMPVKSWVVCGETDGTTLCARITSDVIAANPLAQLLLTRL